MDNNCALSAVELLLRSELNIYIWLLITVLNFETLTQSSTAMST